MQTEMSSSPAGGLCLSSGKHTGILTYIQEAMADKRCWMLDTRKKFYRRERRDYIFFY
jgi:hypothetical protein